MIKKLLKKLDSFLDRKWKETSKVLYQLAGVKETKDKDWTAMQNNINRDKKNEN
tara:strand:+ start:16179 stop:16340 length:162 start_codon:yes stop_codon:yes gene_type:complete